jgi:membrane protein implicated in regulation of membrane protease activity
MGSIILGSFVVSPALAWLAIGIALMAAEVLAPGFIVFWFGVGALAASLAVFLGLHSVYGELLLFLGVSIGSLLLWHLVLRRRFPGSGKADDRDATISELRGRVTEKVAPEAEGRVELNTPFHGIRVWKARSDEVLESGAEIEVLDAKGIALIVKRSRS